MKRRSRVRPRRLFDLHAEFCFFGELNDFLLPEQQYRRLAYHFNGHPGIKDPIEVFGVPHTEVDLILVNGSSVAFSYQLQDSDRVEVYPLAHGLTMPNAMALRSPVSFVPAFVVDVNLGKLARLLRMLGFDALYENHYLDSEIAALAAAEKRIVLTRDRRLLHAARIEHGYWVRSVVPKQQLAEVVARFGLTGSGPSFRRCSECNRVVEKVAKEAIIELLQPRTRRYYDDFYRCSACGKIYWAGSHVDHMNERFAAFLPGNRNN